MNTARQHWPILRRLGTDLANRVREFMVIGKDGEGVLVATEDGLAFWFGKMRFGLIELRTTDQPTQLNVSGLVSMAQGDQHILLLNKRGEIYSMGKNFCGQLGLGTTDKEAHFSPQLISSPHKFTSVRCGRLHSLALTEDGKVWAWGSNIFGQIGVPTLIDPFPSPRQIPELDSYRVVSIECGSGHSLALTDQGEVYGWGWNKYGQLGDGSETFKLPPTRILTSSPVQSIAAGSRHTLLLTRTGEVYACGSNRHGQLGLPITTRSSPRLSKVEGLSSISQIAAHPNARLSIAMFSNHRCFVWGQMRDQTFIFTPRELPPLYSNVELPLSFYSLHRSTPHSVSIPDTPPSPLSTRMSRMFDNPETSNVQFVVEQRTIHAHRIILSNSLDYFARMFSERWMSPVYPEDPIVRVTTPTKYFTPFCAFFLSFFVRL